MKRIAIVLVCVACSAGTDIAPDPSSSNTTSTGGAGGDGASNEGGATSTGGTSQGSDYENGSRLKKRFIVGTDGSRAPAGLYDSQLEVPCSWQRMQDGTTRCLPVVASPTMYFADAACTQRIAGAACSLSGEYVLAPSPVCPFGSVDVYPLMGPVSAPSLVYAFAGNTCQSLTPPALNWYAVGTALAPDNFVAGGYDFEL
jgi:hypothetical protein